MRIQASNFLVKIFILAVLWALLATNIAGVISFLHKTILDVLQFSSLKLLDFLGYNSFSQDRNFGIFNTPGIILGPPCDGLSLMYVFTSFIIAFPGTWKSKITWILIGVPMIQVLNIFRILSLIILSLYHPEWLSFNHDYTFTFVMYLLIFVSWYFYAKRRPSVG